MFQDTCIDIKNISVFSDMTSTLYVLTEMFLTEKLDILANIKNTMVPNRKCEIKAVESGKKLHRNFKKSCKIGTN